MPFAKARSNSFEGRHVVHRGLINDLPKVEMRVSKALRWATSLFWIDILVTLVILAAVASRL